MASHMGRPASKGAGMGTTLRISAATKDKPMTRLLRIRWFLRPGVSRLLRLGGRLLRRLLRRLVVPLQTQGGEDIAIGTFGTEHQQQVATAIELGSGFDANLGEGLRGVAVDIGDAPDRITGGEALAEPGADDDVVDTDIGGIADMPQFQPVAVAAGDGAQAVAVDLHRQAV